MPNTGSYTGGPRTEKCRLRSFEADEIPNSSRVTSSESFLQVSGQIIVRARRSLKVSIPLDSSQDPQWCQINQVGNGKPCHGYPQALAQHRPGGRAMRLLKWRYKCVNSMDVLPCLKKALLKLEGTMDGIAVGPKAGLVAPAAAAGSVCYGLSEFAMFFWGPPARLSTLGNNSQVVAKGRTLWINQLGDILRLHPKDIDWPVDAILAGPPCPPWAGQGLSLIHI